MLSTMSEDIQLIANIGLVYIGYKKNMQQIVKKRKIRRVWVNPFDEFLSRFVLMKNFDK